MTLSRICLAGVLLFSWPVFADDIDDAIEHLQVGELEEARSILERVTPPTHSALVRFYAARARLAHVTRERSAVTAALRVLATLDPSFEFDETVPRDLVRQLRELDMPPLGLTVESRELDTGLTLQVRVDDLVHVSTGTRLFVRVNQDVIESSDATIAVPLEPGGRVEVWAQMLVNEVVVAEWGSTETPRSFARVASVEDVAADAIRLEQTNDNVVVGEPERHPRRIWIPIVVAAVAIIASTVLIINARNSRDARLGQPTLGGSSVE